MAAPMCYRFGCDDHRAAKRILRLVVRMRMGGAAAELRRLRS